MGSLCWPGIICLQLCLAAGKAKNGLSAEREKWESRNWHQAFGDSWTGMKVKEKILSTQKVKKTPRKQTNQKENSNEQQMSKPANQKNPGFNPSKLLYTEHAALLHQERESFEIFCWEGKPSKTWKLVHQIRYEFWQELSNANAGRWGKTSDPFWQSSTILTLLSRKQAQELSDRTRGSSGGQKGSWKGGVWTGLWTIGRCLNKEG